MSDISGLGEFFCHACTLPDNIEELRRKYFALSEFERQRLREVRRALDAVLRPVHPQAEPTAAERAVKTAYPYAKCFNAPGAYKVISGEREEPLGNLRILASGTTAAEAWESAEAVVQSERAARRVAGEEW